MNRQPGRIGLYLVMLVALIGGYLYLNNQVMSQNNYNGKQLEQALEEDRVVDAAIQPNNGSLTGAVIADIAGEGQKKIYVTDVREAEKMLKDNGVYPDVKDVPRENVFFSTFLPILLTGGLVIFLIMMMNRQMSGGGGGAEQQTMNFGKSRARMSSPDDTKVTFDNVAGLQEEKEDLVEVVDFLKAPEKYTKGRCKNSKGCYSCGSSRNR